MAASTCPGTPGQSWLMSWGCPAPPVTRKGIMGSHRAQTLPPVGPLEFIRCPRTGCALPKNTQQASGSTQHPGLLTPCSVFSPLVSLYHILPSLLQLQPFLLPMPFAVVGKVQGVGFRWRQASPQRSTEAKSGQSKQLLIDNSTITSPLARPALPLP